MEKIFKGIMPALVTPFESDGKTVDEKVARELIEYLLNQGADGFYVLGSTGEGLVMAESERKRMLEIAVSQVAGRKPVICHIAAINLDEAVRLCKHAEKAGADALSAIPPIFFAYTQENIYNYYKTLAESTSLPFVMYNHPSANGGMSADTVAKMFEIENVTGVKWTVNNYFQLMNLKDKTKGKMNIINGPDEMLISGLAAGADAGIGTTYNIMLPQYLEIYRLFNEGKMAEALKIQQQVNRVIDIMISFGVIPAVKYMCEKLGFKVGNATYPMTEFSPKQTAELDKRLAEAGWPFN